MKLTLKTVAKDKFDIDVDIDSSVQKIKEIISEVKSVEVSYVKLIYNGRILKTTETLANIGYREGEWIVLMLRKSKPKSPPVVDNNIVVEEQQCVEDKEQDEIDAVLDELSDRDIQLLYEILNNDPQIDQLLTAYPQLRDQLKNPEILLQLLTKAKHPVVDELGKPDDAPRIIRVTEEEAEDLELIKSEVLAIIGAVPNMSEGRLNAIIYQVYTSANGDIEMAKNFLVNDLMDNFKHL